MRIILTGAAGFIGYHLTNALVDRGHEVFALDDYSGGYNKPKCKVWRIDLATYDLKPLEEFRPEVLVHCAANAREGESVFSPEKITRQNLWAYARTLRTCIHAGNLKRVVCFSSMAVYGDQKPPFDESIPLHPVDVYGWNKAAMEGITLTMAPIHGFKIAVLRPHNVFGPHQSMRDRYRNVCAIFCNRVLKNEPIYIYSDGMQRRSFSYIDDSLDCYVRAVEGAADGHVVNIGGTQETTINDLTRAVLEDFGVSDHKIIHLPARPIEVQDAWTTYRKSQELLGFEERIGWREGVRRMVKWAKEQGPSSWNDYDHVELPRGMGLPETWKS